MATRLRYTTSLMVLLGVGTPWLSARAQSTYPSVKIQGRLHTQAYYFNNEDYQAMTGPRSNFLLRRARIQASGQITETIAFVIVPSFEEGSNRLRLRDAYIDVGLQRGDPRTRVVLRVGQEKRPFGRYELLSSNNLPSIERGAGKGLVKAASNDLFSANGFLSHDIGGSVIVSSRMDESRSWTLQAGLYNGAGETRNDVNDSKSFGVRGTLGITRRLNIGGSFFSHDGIVGTDSSYTNTAWGIDASWGRSGDPGLLLVGDFMRGESAADHDVKLQGLSLIGAYHIRMRDPNGFIYAVEPAVRLDLADPDTDTDDDGSTLFSAGINLYFSSRAEFQAAYEHQGWQAAGARAIQGVRVAMSVHF